MPITKCIFSSECKNFLSVPLCITYGGIFDRACKYKRGMDIDIMLVGLNPWCGKWYRDGKSMHERAFGDKSEKILQKYFTSDLFDLKAIYITNALKCSINTNSIELMYRAFEYCKKKLLAEIKIVKPTIIVALGNEAAKMCTIARIPYFRKMLHPNALSYNNKLESTFKAQVKGLSNSIGGC